MKIYGVESAEFGDFVNSYRKYRWYSKYNGARGPWCYRKDSAEKGGEEHAEVIRALFSCGGEHAIAQQAQECQPE